MEDTKIQLFFYVYPLWQHDSQLIISFSDLIEAKLATLVTQKKKKQVNANWIGFYSLQMFYWLSIVSWSHRKLKYNIQNQFLSFHSIQIMCTALLAVRVPLALDKKKHRLSTFWVLVVTHSLAFLPNDVVAVGQIPTPNQKKTRFTFTSRVYRNKYPPLTSTRVFPPMSNRRSELDLSALQLSLYFLPNNDKPSDIPHLSTRGLRITCVTHFTCPRLHVGSSLIAGGAQRA